MNCPKIEMKICLIKQSVKNTKYLLMLVSYNKINEEIERRR